MPNKDKILKFKVASTVFFSSFALVLGGTLWAYFALRSVSGPVIIHFNNLTGINLIGSYWGLVAMGITGLAVIIINFLIALALEERDRFLAKTMAFATALFGTLIFIALAAIISVN